jgi:hypothetical protein
VEGSAAGAPVRPRRTRRRLWTALAAVAVLLAGGIVTWMSVAVHYFHAPALKCACGLVWAVPDGDREKDTEAVGHTQISVPARHGAWQAFYVEVTNPSSVTQTVLGLTGGELSGWQPRLAIARGDELDAATFHDLPISSRSGPVSIPPNTEAVLRYSVHETQCLARNQVQMWTATVVRVRVGAYTRTEVIDFAGHGMAIVGTGARDCH